MGHLSPEALDPATLNETQRDVIADFETAVKWMGVEPSAPHNAGSIQSWPLQTA